MDQTTERLQRIFRGVFDLPEGSDMSDRTQPNTGTWDSMGHVTLIAALEEAFGIAIDAGDSLELTSYDAVKKYLAGRHG